MGEIFRTVIDECLKEADFRTFTEVLYNGVGTATGRKSRARERVAAILRAHGIEPGGQKKEDVSL